MILGPQTQAADRCTGRTMYAVRAGLKSMFTARPRQRLRRVQWNKVAVEEASHGLEARASRMSKGLDRQPPCRHPSSLTWRDNPLVAASIQPVEPLDLSPTVPEIGMMKV